MMCLGVKDATWSAEFEEQLTARLNTLPGYSMMNFEDISYQDARSLVLGAYDFADENGFLPHEDWHKTKGFVEWSPPYEKKFTFGKNGDSESVAFISLDHLTKALK